jgi:hypothetical protein
VRWLCLTLALGCSALTDLGDLSGGANGADGSSADASPVVIRCGTTTCDPSTSECCATCNAPDGSSSCTFTYSCVDSGSQCPLAQNDLDFGCSDRGSCAPNDVCCAVLGSEDHAYFHDSQCMTAADCDASAPSAQLCDPNAYSPCPPGTTCKKDNGLLPIQGMFV